MAKVRVKTEDLIKDVPVYLKECELNGTIPQVIRFARRHGYTKQGLYQRMESEPALVDSIRQIIEEKELILEENGLIGKYNSSMAIFSLKQLGWKDKNELELSTEDDNTTGLIVIAPVIGDGNG